MKASIKNIIIFLIVLSLIWLTGIRIKDKLNHKPVVQATEEVLAKPVEVIVFSTYSPEKPIEVLGNLDSEQRVIVTAKLSGMIENVTVNIGDYVKKDQVLATFSINNDLTAINYQNALNNLEVVKASTQNAIRSAEIALESAKNSARANEVLEEQNFQNIFSVLYTNAQTSETTALSALDWANQLLGGSRNFRNEVYPVRYEVGSNNSVKKTSTKNLIEELVREYENLIIITDKENEKEVLNFAKNRLDFIKKTREAIGNINDLVRNTPVTKSYPESTRLSLQTQTESLAGRLDGQIVSLTMAIENSQSSHKGQTVTSTGSTNAIKNAEAGLELTKSNAEAQVLAAENGVRLAQKSQNDLTIKAPFSGKISQKIITEGDNVMGGQKCFEIFQDKEQVDTKVLAQLTAEDWQRLNQIPKIQVRLADNENIEIKTKNIFSSSIVDTRTQKVQIEFYIAKEKMPKNVLLGSSVKILIPQSNGHGSDLIPISAISFEPDGAEVLVVGAENKAVRRSIKTGKIRGNSIVVSEGLEAGDKVIKFRNRVFSGELVEIKTE